MSMTPAFSPGPWITHGALVGSVRRWTFEDLYEQCSFHIAEKMPSSVNVGTRPMSSRMRAYSSGLSPCSATSSGVMAGSSGIMVLLGLAARRGNVSGGCVPASISIRSGSTAQRLFGERDPLRLDATDIFRSALELGQNLGEDRLRLVLPAGFVEQQAVTHTRFGARVIVRHRLILVERIVGAAAFVKRAGAEQMRFRRLVIRPAFAQIIERRDRFLRVAAAELGARLAESIDRVVAHRQRENVLVVIFRLGELPQFKTLFGKRRAIGDGVGDFELLGERAVTLRWIERIDPVPA